MRTARGLLAVLVLAAANGPEEDARVEAELALRGRALAPERHRVELLEAARSSSWLERRSALEVLRRALDAGAPPAAWMAVPAREGLLDAHPNVRALAAEVAAELALEPDPVLCERLLADPLPWVRSAVLRHLARAPLDVDPAPLRRLLVGALEDVDPTVREVALGALCLRLEADPDGLGPALAAALAGADVTGFVDLLQRALPVCPPPAFFARTRELLAAPARETRELDEPSRAAALCLLELVAFATPAASGEARVEPVADGLLAAGTADGRVRELLRMAARSRSPVLGEALAETLVLAEAPEAELARSQRRLARDVLALRSGPDDLELALAREAWAAALVDLLGAEETLRRLVAGRLPPRASLVLVEELGRRAPAWEAPGVGAWLAGLPDGERLAVVEALASSLARTGDVAAGDLLAVRLEDGRPAVRERAFDALARSEVAPRWGEALLAAWRGLAPERRLERLADLSRQAPLVPFREELFELGEAGYLVPACELLAPFVGDERVGERLEGWIDREARRVSSGDLAPLPGLRAALRALARVAGPGAVPTLIRLLDLSLGRSAELGKLAALALDRHPTGREPLLERLDAVPDEDRRTRIEIAIALADDEEPGVRERAARSLVRDHPSAAPDLAVRMLEALARGGTELAVAFLQERVLGPETGGAERVTALLACASLGDARGTRLAREAALEGDVDLRRAALTTVLRCGGDEAGATLAELHARFREELGRTGSPDLEALAAEALEALSRLRPLAEAELAAWLDGPRRRRAEDLSARLAGRDLAAVSFTWRAELSLAQRLAARGRLGQALDANPGWWGIDARLLVALGARALAGGGPEAAGDAGRLLAAARVGVLGEREEEAREGAAARRLLLAAAAAAQDDAAFLRQAERLIEGRVRGEVAASTWRQGFGRFDPEAGVDGEARLWSALACARARRALEQGALEEAERQAGRARAVARVSGAAAAEIEDFERALAAARRAASD